MLIVLPRLYYATLVGKLVVSKVPCRVLYSEVDCRRRRDDSTVQQCCQAMSAKAHSDRQALYATRVGFNAALARLRLSGLRWTQASAMAHLFASFLNDH